MRAWTTSACVVLAGSILSIPLAAVGTRGPVHPAPANTRIASSIEVTLTSTLPIAAPAVAASSPAARYVVRPGDTLSGVAAALGVPGGWPALYAANRHAIGHDPDTIRPGTVLVLPSQTAPARYTVAAGDTLSGIAAALGVPGGWPALYAANRHAIGHDPDTIRPGAVLTVPRPAATIPAPPARPSPRPSHQRPAATPPAHRRPPATRPPSPAGTRHHSRPVTKGAPAPTGMPPWLKTMLAAVGLLILAAFLIELVLVARRGQRQGAPQLPQPERARAGGGPCASQPATAKACIVLADHDRLVVACSPPDHTVYVLRPPGEDPLAILRVARLVVPEGSYGELAKQLGVPGIGPVD